MDFNTAAIIVSWLAIALLALGYAGLLREVGELRRARTPQRPSSSLVGLQLPESGELAAIRPAGNGLVVFVSPACSSCAQVLDLLRRRNVRDLVVVSTGACEASAPGRCLPLRGDLLERLGVPATPFLLRTDAAGVITGTLLPTDDAELRAWLGELPLLREDTR